MLKDSGLILIRLPAVKTFTIITTSASKQFESIHNRMPVILSKEGALKWLDKSKKWDSEICHLLRPFDDDLEIYAVTKEMSKPGSSKLSYVQPISQRKDGIRSFFAKQSESPKKDGVNKEDLKKEEGEADVVKKEEDDMDTAIKRSLENTSGGAQSEDKPPRKKAKKKEDNKTLDGFLNQE